MHRIAFQTIGCKLNRAETDMIRSGFLRRGHSIVGLSDNPDVYVLNTCAVTGNAVSKCRKAIRQAVKKLPDATVMVLGCYSQIGSEQIEKIPGVDFILGGDEKFRAWEYLEQIEKADTPYIFLSDHTGEFEYQNELGYSTDRTRAFLKIQDGCSFECTYCIIPQTRGRSRSMNSLSVLNRAQHLIENGYREIVLTGVNLLDYRDERVGDLMGLLREMSELPDIGRIRLSSLEPECITDDFISFIAESNHICQHFHIPLQSGSWSILQRMKRHYSPYDYLGIIEQVCTYMPYAGLGADVMVGFPGESSHDFKETLSLVEQIPFSYLHVFTYSSRPGTEALLYTDMIDAEIAKERSQILHSIAQEKRRTFLKKNLGCILDVLFEEEEQRGWYTGWSGNYIRVRTKGSKLKNQIHSVAIQDLESTILTGALTIK